MKTALSKKLIAFGIFNIALIAMTIAFANYLTKRTVFDRDLVTVSKTLEKAIRTSPYGQEYKDCYFMGAPLQTRAELNLYFVTTYDRCNWFVFQGPMFILGTQNGDIKVVLHSQGHSIQAIPIENQKFDDLIIIEASNTYTKLFQFDGDQYLLVNRILDGGRGRGLTFFPLLIVGIVTALLIFYLEPWIRKTGCKTE